MSIAAVKLMVVEHGLRRVLEERSRERVRVRFDRTYYKEPAGVVRTFDPDEQAFASSVERDLALRTAAAGMPAWIKAGRALGPEEEWIWIRNRTLYHARSQMEELDPISLEEISERELDDQGWDETSPLEALVATDERASSLEALFPLCRGRETEKVKALLARLAQGLDYSEARRLTAHDLDVQENTIDKTLSRIRARAVM